MFRLAWRRDNGCISTDHFDNSNDAEVVFDFVTRIFDTEWACLLKRNDTNGWDAWCEFGEEF